MELVINQFYPQCAKCKAGVLIPLSDEGVKGAQIQYKVWACTNCEFRIMFKSGQVIRSTQIDPDHPMK